MSETFYMVVLALIGAAYAFIAAMVVWSAIGPALRDWAAKRKRARLERLQTQAHPGTGERASKRPAFHPNL